MRETLGGGQAGHGMLIAGQKTCQVVWGQEMRSRGTGRGNGDAVGRTAHRGGLSLTIALDSSPDRGRWAGPGQGLMGCVDKSLPSAPSAETGGS